MQVEGEGLRSDSEGWSVRGTEGVKLKGRKSTCTTRTWKDTHGQRVDMCSIRGYRTTVTITVARVNCKWKGREEELLNAATKSKVLTSK